jgi:hypothetical protein
MKKFKNIFLPLLLVVGLGFSDCKNKSEKTNTVNTSSDSSSTAPVKIESDDVLKNGVKDATKDFPGVTATVNNGEITLTGEINRDRLQILMQSLNSLHPKKINNNLTIK